MATNLKRFLSALLAFVLVFSMMPMNTQAATGAVVDAAVLFSDLHSYESNYKTDVLHALMSTLKKTGVTYTSVTSCGDAFSVNNDSGNSGFNKYTGYTATLANAIRGTSGLNDSTVDVNFVWSDHDRYAVKEDGSTPIDKTSHVAYGAGTDGILGTADDGNYYIYVLSMADTSTSDRYGAGFLSNRASNGFTASVETAIANFQADAAKMHKDRPLLIASHQPLLDNRNDNGHAYKWATAINAVALNMDVAFFFGHNHRYDKASDYYYAKGSTMSVCSDSSGNAKSVVLNFAHICAGYLEPKSSTSYSSTTRIGTAISVLIYADSIRYTTYNGSGVYSGNYALDVTIPRDHASVVLPEIPETTVPEETVPEVTVPEVTVPEETVPEETVPEETVPEETVPEESGKIWRKATSITAGKKYILVNYGYNASGVDTYAVGSDAAPVAVTVKTDSTGAYIVSDDSALAWTATAKGSQFTLKNAENGKYLRAASSASGSTGQNITANSSVGTYGCWSLETKNGCQVLAVRRSSSSNYYPARYNSGKFQSFSSSRVGTMSNWLVVFEETDEDAHQHKFTTVTVAATCTTDGSVTKTCACGQKTVEVLKALGHEYTCVETAATCTQAGSKVYTCACGDTYTESIPATGHSYTAKVTAATCTQEGSKVYTCVCGDTYTESIPATGHSYTAKVTAPTCEKAGYTTYTCTCGDSYTDNEVAATGHSYTSAEKDGYMVYTCACGHSYSEKLTVEVSYKKVSSLSGDNSYVITVSSGSKYYALSHANNKLSAVRVTVSNGEITSEITDDLVWDYNGKVLSYESNGTTYNLYASGSSLTVSTSKSSTVTFSSNRIKLGSYYLRYSGSKISLSRFSSSTATVFEETEA